MFKEIKSWFSFSFLYKRKKFVKNCVELPKAFSSKLNSGQVPNLIFFFLCRAYTFEENVFTIIAETNKLYAYFFKYKMKYNGFIINHHFLNTKISKLEWLRLIKSALKIQNLMYAKLNTRAKFSLLLKRFHKTGG